MTSREIHDRVGGFGTHKKLVFWHEDAAYVRSVLKHGYRTAILEELQVWHAGSPYYSKPSPAKLEFHEHHRRTEGGKDAVKNILLRHPLREIAERPVQVVWPSRTSTGRRTSGSDPLVIIARVRMRAGAGRRAQPSLNSRIESMTSSCSFGPRPT